jgi:mRNA-degrading endonuclease RelE of RelBE toxin-antitoxin system
MEIVFTSRFLKDLKDVKMPKHKKATDEVIETIKNAPDFVKLHELLDIKKLNPGLGGYRIRYTNNPEYRIRFDILEDASDRSVKKVELQRCLTREDYEKYAHRKINESTTPKSRKQMMIISESQYKRLFKL